MSSEPRKRLDDGARARQVEKERRRAAMLDAPEFARTVLGLMDGLAIEAFTEDWQQVTIVNQAKELALAVHLDGRDFAAARSDLEAFFERKRRFFLSEDEPDDDGGE